MHYLKNNRASLKKQSGVTLMGLLVVSVFIIMVSILGMKIVPAYMEFLSIKKVLNAMQQEPLATMNASDIKQSFDRRASIEYISVIKGSDLNIEKNESGVIVSVDYQVVKPIVGNVSVLIDFSTSDVSQNDELQ